MIPVQGYAELPLKFLGGQILVWWDEGIGIAAPVLLLPGVTIEDWRKVEAVIRAATRADLNEMDEELFQALCALPESLKPREVSR